MARLPLTNLLGLAPQAIDRRCFLQSAGTGLLALASPTAAVADDGAPSAAPGNNSIDAEFGELTTSQSPGLVLGVRREGSTVLNASYGYADLEAPRSIDEGTVFHVASLSKQFTAFAIALLAEHRCVDLDKDIREYLPYVPDFGATITCRHLVHHTSGLRDQWPLLVLSGKQMGDVLRQQDVLDLVSRQQALNFEPGQDYAYCNTGYTLLAEIVEATSGKSLREFTDEQIFSPLGMNATAFADDIGEIVPERAFSYRRSGETGPWRRIPFNYETVGATGLRTTAGDLLTWCEHLARPAICDPALIERMTRQTQLTDGTVLRYGFGLVNVNVGNHKLILHTGSDAGFRSAMLWLPEQDLAMVVLMNNSGDIFEAVRLLVDEFLGEPLLRQPAPTSVPESLRRQLAGHYADTSGRMIGLERYRDGMRWKRGQHDNRTLVFREDGSFDFGKRMSGWFAEVRDEDGRVSGIEAFDPFAIVAARRIYRRAEPCEPEESELADITGDYHSTECDVTYTVALEGKRLLLSSLLTDPVELSPSLRDRFDTDDWAVGSVSVERTAAGTIAALSFTSSRVASLRLQRVGSS